MLPLIVPSIPEIINTGLLELLATMFAVPKVESWGGEVMSETGEFEGHENPAPLNVIVKVSMSLAFCKVTNNMTLRWMEETDAMGVDNEIRFVSAQVVTNLYRKLGRIIKLPANDGDF